MISQLAVYQWSINKQAKVKCLLNNIRSATEERV
ncbi:Uncharacterised protein [Pragia fontium]|nr:Uncharacterised protein [Pragia fontium]